MKLQRNAVAGTLESSDIMVRIQPGEAGAGVRIELESSVMQQYGEAIVHTIAAVMKDMEIEDALVAAVDHGALECTIKARVETAVRRGCQEVKA